MIVAAASLMIVGYLGLGALVQLLVRDLPTGLGLTGLIVSPAFGFLGVGFPVLGMNAFSHRWGAILPLRWYMAVLLGQAARGLPVQVRLARSQLWRGSQCYSRSWLSFACVIAARIGRRMPRREPAPPVAAPRRRRSLCGRMGPRARNARPFAVLIMAPLIYGISSATLSRANSAKDPDRGRRQRPQRLEPRIVQTLEASGAVSVAVRANTLDEGHAAVDRGEAFAVVGIPPGTERDVLKGISGHIPVYADATYLFIFRTTANGIALAIKTFSSELAASGARADGSLVKAALASLTPADVLLQPIFNPVGGYASYVVPAAFVLILQQTLLIGSATLSGLAVAQAAGERSLM